MQELKIIDADTALIDGAEYKRVWVEEWPKRDDKIAIVNHYGEIVERSYNDHDLDHKLHARSRIFRTREEAEQDKLTGLDAKLVAQTKINRFCDAEGIENKWVTGAIDWCPFYDHRLRKVDVMWVETLQYSSIFHVRTREDANKIIAACGNEIEILLGVGGE